VGSTAFKAAETSDPRLAGSIPVHLRHIAAGTMQRLRCSRLRPGCDVAERICVFVIRISWKYSEVSTRTGANDMSDLSDRTIIDPPVAEPLLAPPVVVEPVVAAPVVAEPMVVEQVVAEPVVAPVMATSRTVRRAYARSLAPDAIVAAAVGLVVLLFGLVAITRAGFDGPMDTPIVTVMGFTHTALFGLLEIVVGACLLISGATRSRSAALFFGSVLGITAFVGAVQSESFQENLALESGFAWLLVFGGVTVVLAALLLPRYIQRSTVVYPT
jgi:hypothetical protein